MKKILILYAAITLGGCRVQLGKTYKMVVITPYEGFDVYTFRAGRSRILVKDSAGAFQFGDSIEIRRK